MRSLLPLAALFGLALAGPADAAAVVLWPVDPVIAAGQQSASIWIENRGDEAVTMQVRSLGWNQAGGEDDYARQDEVVSSPPIAEIAPGARQLIRVIRRDAADPAGERAYRMLIDELPKAVDPAAPARAASATLAVQMRYSIPLFTYGKAEAAAPALTGRIVSAGGRRFVELRNAGGRHARLTDIRLVDGGRTTMLMPGLAGYVLAGAIRRLDLPAGAPDAGKLLIGVDGVDQTISGAI